LSARFPPGNGLLFYDKNGTLAPYLSYKGIKLVTWLAIAFNIYTFEIIFNYTVCIISIVDLPLQAKATLISLKTLIEPS